MDQVLKQEMDNLKRETNENGAKLDELSEMVREMSFALMGNKFTKDGGIISRVIQLEVDLRVVKKELEDVKADRNKSDVYVKILWAAGGVVCTIFLTILLNYLFKK